MELRTHLQVLWRFRLIILGGLVLGTMIAIFAAFNVRFDGGPKLEWRSAQVYESHSTLFVTQNGFPWGRTTLPAVTNPEFAPPAEEDKKSGRREYGAPERFSDLAILYSYLASSQQVRAMIRPTPAPDQVTITPVMNPASGAGLPLLKVSALAGNGELAQHLNTSTVDALKRYLEEQQRGADIEAGARVEIEVLNPPSKAVVSEGRSYMGSVIAFILAVAAAIGLAYLLENLRPRPTQPSDDEFELEEAWAEFDSPDESHDRPQRTAA